jgi:prolyl-tRNA synthetase
VGIVAAAIEQGADEKGIVWPASIAPWGVELVALSRGTDETVAAAGELYERLQADGLEVLHDDREAGPGEKLTDAELIRCTLRIVVGKRALAEGEVETQERGSGREERLPLADTPRRVAEILGALE